MRSMMQHVYLDERRPYRKRLILDHPHPCFLDILITIVFFNQTASIWPICTFEWLLDAVQTNM